MHKKRKEEGLMTKLAKVTTLPKVVNLGWSRDKGQSKDNASISDKDLYAFFFMLQILHVQKFGSSGCILKDFLVI